MDWITEELVNLFSEFDLNDSNLFTAILSDIQNGNSYNIENIRNEIIDSVTFKPETNSIGFKEDKYIKLMKIIRYIDWTHYISVHSLNDTSEIIQDYKLMLYFVFSNIDNEDIIDEFIYSSSKFTDYKKAKLNNETNKDLAKIVLTSMAELTDTYAIKLIDKYNKTYKID